MVTIHPLMASNCKSSGIAVISFDLLSVFSWPRTRPPFCEHHAETICKGEAAVARSKEALTVLPSSETRAPCVRAATALGPGQKALLKTRGIETSKDAAKGIVGRDTMRQSQEGLEPWRLLLPKSSISWNPSPPVSRVHTAMIRISSRDASWSVQSVGPLKSGNARQLTRSQDQP